MPTKRFPPHQPEGEICQTCGDRAIPVQVLELRRPNVLVEDAKGVRYEVAADLIKPLNVGDTLLVHAGVAIARVNPARKP